MYHKFKIPENIHILEQEIDMEWRQHFPAISQEDFFNILTRGLDIDHLYLSSGFTSIYVTSPGHKSIEKLDVSLVPKASNIWINDILIQPDSRGGGGLTQLFSNLQDFGKLANMQKITLSAGYCAMYAYNQLGMVVRDNDEVKHNIRQNYNAYKNHGMIDFKGHDPKAIEAAIYDATDPARPPQSLWALADIKGPCVKGGYNEFKGALAIEDGTKLTQPNFEKYILPPGEELPLARAVYIITDNNILSYRFYDELSTAKFKTYSATKNIMAPQHAPILKPIDVEIDTKDIDLLKQRWKKNFPNIKCRDFFQMLTNQLGVRRLSANIERNNVLYVEIANQGVIEYLGLTIDPSRKTVDIEQMYMASKGQGGFTQFMCNAVRSFGKAGCNKIALHPLYTSLAAYSHFGYQSSDPASLKKELLSNYETFKKAGMIVYEGHNEAEVDMMVRSALNSKQPLFLRGLVDIKASIVVGREKINSIFNMHNRFDRKKDEWKYIGKDGENISLYSGMCIPLSDEAGVFKWSKGRGSRETMECMNDYFASKHIVDPSTGARL